MKDSDFLQVARRVIQLESEALNYVSSRLDEQFSGAVSQILGSPGRLVVCGMGKSGHIGRKIFATLVSTGTPALFMHPGEAFHGDLGMVQPSDLFLAISNSGETEEILKLIPFLKDNGNTLISMTGRPESTLAKYSDYHLDVGVQAEACPLQLAPTSSTTAALAVGDALAVALMECRGFKQENFARFHPGGALGRKLLSTVGEHAEIAPKISSDATFTEIISALMKCKAGVCCVVSDEGLAGVITDGDLKREMAARDFPEYRDIVANKIMTSKPKVVGGDIRCGEADQYMAESGVNSLVVSFESGNFGIYHNLNRSLK